MLQVFEAKISTELFVSNCVLEKSEIKKVLSRRMFIWFVYSSGWVGGWALIDFPFPPHPIFHVDLHHLLLEKK